MKFYIVLLSVLVVSACNELGDDSLKKSLLKRVSFDFECETKDIHLTELSRSKADNINSFGAKGCGQKGVYTRPLENTYWSRDS